jgi:hypothetical protein
MGQPVRNAAKPECISAVALRAQARALLSVGQTCGCFSAKYSVMANESHTVNSSSTSTGTLAVGEKDSKPVAPPPMGNGFKLSSNAMPSVRINTQGRSDQEE